jgi:hypothetical protein
MAFRQLILNVVDCLEVIYEIESRNPEVKLGGGSDVLDLMKIIHRAYQMFWRHWIRTDGFPYLMPEDQKAFPNASKEHPVANLSRSALDEKYPFETYEWLVKRLFYDLCQLGTNGSMSYLAKSCLSSLPIEIDYGRLSLKIEESIHWQPESLTSQPNDRVKNNMTAGDAESCRPM